MKLSVENIDRLIEDLVRLRAALTSTDQRHYLLITHLYTVTGVTAEEIMSKKRNKSVSDARCMLIHHMFETGYTKTGIARHLGLDHASVIHALRNYKRFYEIDFEFREVAINLNESWKKHLNTLSQLQSNQAT